MDRRTALGKMTFDDEEHRKIWQDVLKLELIRSEENDAVIKSLPWCSKQFCEFVAHLDIQAVSNKLAMAKKQSKALEKLLHVLSNYKSPRSVFSDK